MKECVLLSMLISVKYPYANSDVICAGINLLNEKLAEQNSVAEMLVYMLLDVLILILF